MLSLFDHIGASATISVRGTLESGSAFLQALWTGVFGHLWETTLFFCAIVLVSQLFRQAPSALRHKLWSLALLKLFLPVSLLGGIIERAGLFQRGPSEGLLVLAPLSWSDPIGSVIIPADPTSGTAIALLWLGSTVWLGVATRILLRSGLVAHRLTSGPPIALSEDHVARIRELAKRLDLSPELLVVTREPTVPCVAGILRPRIYLPLEILDTFSRDALFAVALHERAHLRRREPLQLLVRRLAFALFFYFPPLWFVLGRLHRTAEVACDEEAVAAGAEAHVLVRAISQSVRSGLRAPSPAAALGSAHRSLLTERLHRLESNRRYRPMHHHRGALALTALALAALVLAPRPNRVDAAVGEASPEKGAFVSQLTVDDTEEAGTTTAAIEGTQAPKTQTGSDAAESEIVPPKPIPDSMTNPEYPEDCRKDGASGRVLLKIRISETGAVTSTEEVEGVEGYPSFTKAAEAAVIQWRFEPATQDGEAIPIEVIVPVQFALD